MSRVMPAGQKANSHLGTKRHTTSSRPDRSRFLLALCSILVLTFTRIVVVYIANFPPPCVLHILLLSKVMWSTSSNPGPVWEQTITKSFTSRPVGPNMKAFVLQLVAGCWHEDWNMMRQPAVDKKGQFLHLAPVQQSVSHTRSGYTDAHPPFTREI